jgi:hypothetical protein
MLAWLRRRRSSRPVGREPAHEPRPTPGQQSALAGEYGALYKYLKERYSDNLVLTFAEIEDLLGFTLPAVARQRAEWWTQPAADTPRPCYSDAWVLAGRTARPNLHALIVAFDRAM